MLLAYLYPRVGTNVLKIWTFLPNGTADDNPLNDTVTACCCGCDSALAGDYTVGGLQSDFPDLASAWDALLHCGVSAPVRLQLQSGRYAVRFALRDSVPGSDSTNRITIISVAQDADSVLLYRDSVSEGQRAAVSLVGTSHIILEELTIAPSAAHPAPAP